MHSLLQPLEARLGWRGPNSRTRRSRRRAPTSRIPRSSSIPRTSGYASVTSLRFRLSSRSRPGWAYAIARTPSHLTSNDQSRCRGGSAVELRAIIGTTCSGIGTRSGSSGGSIRWISQSFPRSPRGRSETARSGHGAARRGTPTSTLRSSHFSGSYVPVSQIVIDPGAVLALRNFSGELEVLERVVLGADRETVLLRVLRDPVRDRPRRERPVVLEPQVPVQPRRVVLLNDEPRRSVRGCRLRVAAGGFGRRVEVTFGAVALERVLRGPGFSRGRHLRG